MIMKWIVYSLLVILVALHFWRCYKDEEPWLRPSLILILVLCVVTVVLPSK
jgi:heme/copper-type cytochrome/quinol oxidase subunit 4